MKIIFYEIKRLLFHWVLMFALSYQCCVFFSLSSSSSLLKKILSYFFYCYLVPLYPCPPQSPCCCCLCLLLFLLLLLILLLHFLLLFFLLLLVSCDLSHQYFNLKVIKDWREMGNETRGSRLCLSQILFDLRASSFRLWSFLGHFFLLMIQ